MTWCLADLCSCGRRSSTGDAGSGLYIRVLDARGGPRSYPQRRARMPATRGRSPPQPYGESKEDEAQQPLIAVEEKEVLVEVEDENDGDMSPAPLSPQSSVVSIPSTRVTVLSSEHTGTTTLVSSSLEEGGGGSRPPSYYSDTLRSASPAHTEDGGHPVMDLGWLDRLQRRANAKLIDDDVVPRSNGRSGPD